MGLGGWSMLVFVVQAWATSSGEAAPCPPTRVTPVMPLVGDLDVPPDVRPLLLLEGCGTAAEFALADSAGAPVAFTLETPFPSYQRVVPDAPLTPGELYTLVDASYYAYYGDLAWFTVGDGVAAPPTPGPPGMEVEFAHTCGDFTILEAFAELDFADADPAQRGMLVLTSSIDGLEQFGAAPMPYTGQATQSMTTRLPGGHELCVSARLEDLAGAVVWETEELCSGEVSCPGDPDDGDGAGACGCDGAGGPGGAGALVALALVGAARRSRSRRRSCSSS